MGGSRVGDLLLAFPACMTPSSRLTTLALPLAFAALSLATVRSQTDWIERKPAHAPPARSYHAMACDSLRGRIVLFGGQVSQGNPLGDTWEWDGVDWQQATPLTSPPAQSRHALAFDAARGVVVLVGTNGDMWEFDGTTWNAAPPCPGSPLYTDVGVLMAYDASRSRLCVVGSNGSPVHEYDGAAWSTITAMALVLMMLRSLALCERKSILDLPSLARLSAPGGSR